MTMTLKMMTKTISDVSVIVTAAGSSVRFGGECKKECLPYKDGTVLTASIKTFLSLNNEKFKISTLIVTAPRGGASEMENMILRDSHAAQQLTNVRFFVVEGGVSRQESVYNALKKNAECNFETDVVLIHDGARPFVSENLIENVIEASLKYEAAVPALSPTDTFKIVDEENFITSGLQRKYLRAVQTPQGFLFKKLLDAYNQIVNKDGLEKLSDFTDDAEIWGKFYNGIKTVDGEKSNIKITFPSDRKMLLNDSGEKMIRVGLGYDLHRLVEGRKLIIGGIKFDFEKGEYAHSDGDVLLHAVTDAVLGACGLGDIGSYFPPEDSKWKDADSAFLLKTVMKDVRKNGWEIQNIDCVLKLEKPKFLPHRNEVIESVAEILGVSKDCVFIKAKTGEKLPPVGTGDAVEAEVVALLYRT